MSYVFDANTGGATFSDLRDMVLANSFSEARYGELASAWLNDAVVAVCRRLRAQRDMTILPFTSAGIVTQPAAPYFHVEELCLATAGATGTGEQAVGRFRGNRLSPLPNHSPQATSGTAPVHYIARRVAAPGSRYPQLQIVVTPCTVAGLVTIVGLHRPPVMSDDADLSGLGADLDDALVAFVKARCFRNEDDFEMSDRWKLEYEGALHDAVELDPQSDGPYITPGDDDDALPYGGR